MEYQAIYECGNLVPNAASAAVVCRDLERGHFYYTLQNAIWQDNEVVLREYKAKRIEHSPRKPVSGPEATQSEQSPTGDEVSSINSNSSPTPSTGFQAPCIHSPSPSNASPAPSVSYPSSAIVSGSTQHIASVETRQLAPP